MVRSRVATTKAGPLFVKELSPVEAKNHNLTSAGKKLTAFEYLACESMLCRPINAMTR